MNYLNHPQIEAVMNTLDQESFDYIRLYFKDAPDWVLDAVSVQTLKKNEVFIREGGKIQYIHMLVKGTVKATDCRIYGAMYDYMWFRPVKAFGALEVILDEKEYKTTLTANEPCTLFVLQRSVYERWMSVDNHAFKMEARTTANSLLKQTRRERVYLFMQGMDRMAYFMLHYYEQFAKDGKCRVTLTRQDISDCTGLSIKTVNRSIGTLEESGCIKRDGSHILITQKEFEELQHYVAELIE